MAYFFRDPWRVTPTRPGLIVSPADGVVVSLGAAPPPRARNGNRPLPRIASSEPVRRPCRAAPIGGKLAARRYTKGRFVNASSTKASTDNERLALRIVPDEGPAIACVLIAGLVARRIVCILYEGSRSRPESASASSASARGPISIARAYVPLVPSASG